MKLPAVLFMTALAVTATSGVSAQPVTTDALKVIEGVEDCASSMSSVTLDENLLVDRGWFKVEIQMTNNPVTELPTVYGKSENHPLVRIVENQSGQKGCMVEGWFDPEADRTDLFTMLTEKFGEPTSVEELNVTDLTSGASIENGTTAYRSGDAIVIPLEGSMLGQSDFRIIVTLPGVAE
ncbi:MAG: hypothetical protein ABJN35_10000 [Erythrobacter sp.]